MDLDRTNVLDLDSLASEGGGHQALSAALAATHDRLTAQVAQLSRQQWMIGDAFRQRAADIGRLLDEQRALSRANTLGRMLEEQEMHLRGVRTLSAAIEATSSTALPWIGQRDERMVSVAGLVMEQLRGVLDAQPEMTPVVGATPRARAAFAEWLLVDGGEAAAVAAGKAVKAAEEVVRELKAETSSKKIDEARSSRTDPQLTFAVLGLVVTILSSIANLSEDSLVGKVAEHALDIDLSGPAGTEALDGHGVFVTTTDVNLRSGPTTASDVLGVLPAGTLVLVSDRFDGWLSGEVRVSSGDENVVRYGWVKRDYLVRRSD